MNLCKLYISNYNLVIFYLKYLKVIKVIKCDLHPINVAGYFVTDICKNDCSRILLYLGVKKTNIC